MLKKMMIILFFLFCLFISNSIFATDKQFIDIESEAAVVIDYETGRVLYEKNATQKMKMASLTKIMTSILLVEHCPLNEMIEVPKGVVNIGGTTVGLKAGDTVSANSLLYGMLLPSGNDCAYTAGIHLGGSVEGFAQMMNEKAQELGLTDTHFANPHGLDDENHYTTALSMAKIARYALNNKTLNEIVKTKQATINFGSFTKTLNNTNALLNSYEFADGIKTGFTNGANRCLAASATKDGKRFIAIVLGAQTTQIRFQEAKLLLEECFNRYTMTDISSYLHFYINIPVIKGNIASYEKSITDTLVYPLQEGEFDKIYVRQDTLSKLEAPIPFETNLGTIQVTIDDEIIYEKTLFLDQTITKKTMLDYIQDGISNMFLPIPSI